MPIYEYRCERCDLKFEIFHRSGQEEKPVCPDCKTPEVRKLFSVFGFSSGGNFASSSSKGAGCSTCGTKNCSCCG